MDFERVFGDERWRQVQSNPRRLAKARDKLFDQYVGEDPERKAFYEKMPQPERDSLRADFTREVNQRFGHPFRYQEPEEPEQATGERVRRERIMTTADRLYGPFGNRYSEPEQAPGFLRTFGRELVANNNRLGRSVAAIPAGAYRGVSQWVNNAEVNARLMYREMRGNLDPAWLERMEQASRDRWLKGPDSTEIRAYGDPVRQWVDRLVVDGEAAVEEQRSELQHAGMPARWAFDLATMGYNLAGEMLMMRAATGGIIGPRAGASNANTYLNYAKGTMKQATRAMAYLYVRTPGTHEERVRAAVQTGLYHLTPVASMRFGSQATRYVADVLLNSGYSVSFGQYDAAAQQARAMAEAETDTLWEDLSRWKRAQYLGLTMTPIALTDAIMSMGVGMHKGFPGKAVKLGTARPWVQEDLRSELMNAGWSAKGAEVLMQQYAFVSSPEKSQIEMVKGVVEGQRESISKLRQWAKQDRGLFDELLRQRGGTPAADEGRRAPSRADTESAMRDFAESGRGMSDTAREAATDVDSGGDIEAARNALARDVLHASAETGSRPPEMVLRAIAEAESAEELRSATALWRASVLAESGFPDDLAASMAEAELAGDDVAWNEALAEAARREWLDRRHPARLLAGPADDADAAVRASSEYREYRDAGLSDDEAVAAGREDLDRADDNTRAVDEQARTDAGISEDGHNAAIIEAVAAGASPDEAREAVARDEAAAVEQRLTEDKAARDAALQDARRAQIAKVAQSNYRRQLGRMKAGRSVEERNPELLTLYGQQAGYVPERVYQDLRRAGYTDARSMKLVRQRFGAFAPISEKKRMEALSRAPKDLGEMVMLLGGIRRYDEQADGSEPWREEYNTIPVQFRRKDGMPLDEMLEQLVHAGIAGAEIHWIKPDASESDLIEALVNVAAGRKATVQSEDDWWAEKAAEHDDLVRRADAGDPEAIAQLEAEGRALDALDRSGTDGPVDAFSGDPDDLWLADFEVAPRPEPKPARRVARPVQAEADEPALIDDVPESRREPVRGETKRVQVEPDRLLGGLKDSVAAGKAERAQGKLELEAKPDDFDQDVAREVAAQRTALQQAGWQDVTESGQPARMERRVLHPATGGVVDDGGKVVSLGWVGNTPVVELGSGERTLVPEALQTGRLESAVMDKAMALLADRLGVAVEDVRAAAVETVVRRDEPGAEPSPDKPQGLYLNAEGELTGVVPEMTQVTRFLWNPRNQLDVSEDRRTVQHRRGGGGDFEPSAGIKALRALVGEDEFNRLVVMSKRDAMAEAREAFPDVAWGRYVDAYEVLEGYAGMLARSRGYDAILDADERVALSASAIDPGARPQGAGAETGPGRLSDEREAQHQADIAELERLLLGDEDQPGTLRDAPARYGARRVLRRPAGMVRELSPAVATMGARVADYHAAKGVTAFGDFARAVQAEMPKAWDAVKPYLRTFWEAAAIEHDGLQEVSRKEAAAAIAAVEARPEGAAADTEPARGDALPDGWSEASAGGMATSGDPRYGGIVDKAAVKGDWFAVPLRKGMGTLEGFASRQEALDALFAAYREQDRPQGAAADTEPAALEKPPAGMRAIGRNAAGQTIFEDGNGVRHLSERGLLISETVPLVPTRQGVFPRPPENREARFTPVGADARPQGAAADTEPKPVKARRVARAVATPDRPVLDLEVTGQTKPLPGSDGLNYVVHHSPKDMRASRGEFRVTILAPSRPSAAPIFGYGDTERAAFDRAVDGLKPELRDHVRQALGVEKEGLQPDADGRRIESGRGKEAGDETVRGRLSKIDAGTQAEGVPDAGRERADGTGAGDRAGLPGTGDDAGPRDGDEVGPGAGTVARGPRAAQDGDGDRGAAPASGGTERGDRTRGRPAAGSRRAVPATDTGTGVKPDAALGELFAAAQESASQRRAQPEARQALIDEPGPTRNFRYSPEDRESLGLGTAFEKAEGNLAAIRALVAIEREGREATPDERRALSRYVGWGNTELKNAIFPLSDRGAVISPHARRFAPLAKELKALLSDEDYATARRSVQYAHYTGPEVVAAIYAALDRLGFRGGRALEPGSGVGRFLGLAPDDLAGRMAMTGVEMDGISARIARVLYPDADMRHQDFIKMPFMGEVFDLVVGNPPFSSLRVTGDPRYKKESLMLHDYFIRKSMDMLKPGGVMALVTSKGTMDKSSDGARRLIADQADLIGAIRLPQTAFKADAGTEVVTDILFFRKREPMRAPAGERWLDLADVDTPEGRTRINEYFVRHPEMVLGTHSLTGKMRARSGEYTVLPLDRPIAESLAGAVKRLPEMRQQGAAAATGPEAAATGAKPPPLFDHRPVNTGASDAGMTLAEAAGSVPDGSYFVHQGRVYQHDAGVARPVISIKAAKDKLAPKDAEVVSAGDLAILGDYVPLRDAYRAVLQAQRTGTDDELSDAQADLQRAYRRFKGKHGRLMQYKDYVRTNPKTGESYERRVYPIESVVADDAFAHGVLALEQVDDAGTVTGLAPIAHERVIGTKPAPKIENATDALMAVLGDSGKVDLAAVARLAGVDEAVAADELAAAGRIFRDPGVEGSPWVTREQYLSGNIREKLDAAEAAVKKGDEWASGNVEALKAAMPAPLTASRVRIQIGSPVLADRDVVAFMAEVGGVSGVKVQHAAQIGRWLVSGDRDKGKYGTPDRSGVEILKSVLEGRPIVITRKDGDTSYVDKDASALAQARADQLREDFARWVHENPERSARLTDAYNKRFNVWRAADWDGSHLRLPGLASTAPDPYPHQRALAWRFIQQGNTYAAHEVGLGKTLAGAATIMEARRLGVARKPMVVVPQHLLAQWNSDFHQFYPGARIILADEKNFVPKKRQKWMARVANGDYDAVILTSSAFKLIGMAPETELAFLAEQMAQVEGILNEIDRGDSSRAEVENMRERLQQKIDGLTHDLRRDKGLLWDDLGVDMLVVDEAHEYRKLFFPTRMGQIKGVDPNGSGRAWDLYMKTRSIEAKTPGRGLLFLSGTPVVNTMGEVFSIQRYLQPKVLKDMGLEHFDTWVANFAATHTEMEKSPGVGYQAVSRLSNWFNLGAMSGMWQQIGDYRRLDNLPYMEGRRPKIKGGGWQAVVSDETPAQRYFREHVVEDRLERIRQRSGRPAPGDDVVLSVITDAKLVALDDRFINRFMRVPDPEMQEKLLELQAEGAGKHKSKMDVMAERIAATHKATADTRRTQIVFIDEGKPGIIERRGFSPYLRLREALIEAGVPANEIVFMEDHKKLAARQKLQADMNEGRVRVLIGSTLEMGTGLNVQKRLIEMHRATVTWYPAAAEQADGRIYRQGNENPEIAIYNYATKGTVEEFVWDLNRRKSEFIQGFMRGGVDEFGGDLDESGNEYAMMVQAASADPRVKQLGDMQARLARLMSVHRGYLDEQQRIGQHIEGLKRAEERARQYAAKARDMQAAPNTRGDAFSVQVMGETFTDRKKAGSKLMGAIATMQMRDENGKIGAFGPYDVIFRKKPIEGFPDHIAVLPAGVPEGSELRYDREIVKDLTGDGLLRGIEDWLAKVKDLPGKFESEAARIAAEVETALKRQQPFDQDAEMTRLRQGIRDLQADMMANPVGGQMAAMPDDSPGDDSPGVVRESAARYGSAMPRIADVMPDAAVTHTQTKWLVRHPEFEAAKRGRDAAAAARIVDKFLKADKIEEIRRQLPPGKPVIVVPVLHAEDNRNINTIPVVYAEVLAHHLGGRTWLEIGKTSGDALTGARADARAQSAQVFSGSRPPDDAAIVLVDDTFTSGKTLLALQQVIGRMPDAVSTLSYGQYGSRLTPAEESISLMLSKAEVTREQFENILGYPPESLTGAQIQAYLNNGGRGQRGLTARFAPGAGPDRGQAGDGGVRETATESLTDNDLEGYISRQNIPAQYRDDALRMLRETLNPQQLSLSFDTPVRGPGDGAGARRIRRPARPVGKPVAVADAGGYEPVTLTARERAAVEQRVNAERAAWYEGKWREAFEAVGEGRAVMRVIPELVSSSTPRGMPVAGMKITSPAEVHALMRPLRSPYVESMKVLWLDSARKALRLDVLSIGVLDASLASPTAALRLRPPGSANAILSHNHSSGNPMPSSEDVQITRQFGDAFKQAGITLVDHVPTNGKRYHSMRNSGLVDFDEYRVATDLKARRIPVRPVPKTAETAEWEIVPMGDEIPWLGSLTSVRSPAVVRYVVQAFADGEQFAHVLLMSVKYDVVGVLRIRPDMDAGKLAALIARNMAEAGAGAVILQLPADTSRVGAVKASGAVGMDAGQLRWLRQLYAGLQMGHVERGLIDVILTAPGAGGEGEGYMGLRDAGAYSPSGGVGGMSAPGAAVKEFGGRYDAGPDVERLMQDPRVVAHELPRGHVEGQVRRWLAIQRTYASALEASEALPGVPLKDVVKVGLYRGNHDAQQEIEHVYVRHGEHSRAADDLMARHGAKPGDGLWIGVQADPTPYRPQKGEPSFEEWKQGKQPDLVGQVLARVQRQAEKQRERDMRDLPLFGGVLREEQAPYGSGPSAEDFGAVLDRLERTRRSAESAIAIARGLERQAAAARYARHRKGIRQQVEKAAEEKAARRVGRRLDKAETRAAKAEAALKAKREKFIEDGARSFESLTGRPYEGDPASLRDIVAAAVRAGKAAAEGRREVFDVRIAVREIVDDMLKGFKDRPGGRDATIKRLTSIANEIEGLELRLADMDEAAVGRVLATQYQIWAGPGLARAAVAVAGDDPALVYRELRDYVDLRLRGHYRHELRRLFGGLPSTRTTPDGQTVQVQGKGSVTVDRMVDELREPMRKLMAEIPMDGLRGESWRNMRDWYERAAELVAQDELMRDMISKSHKVRRDQANEVIAGEVERGVSELDEARLRSPSKATLPRRRLFSKATQQTRALLLTGGDDDALTQAVMYEAWREANSEQLKQYAVAQRKLDAKLTELGYSEKDVLMLGTELHTIPLPGNQEMQLSKSEMMSLAGIMQDADARDKLLWNGWRPWRLRYDLERTIKGFGETPEDMLAMSHAIASEVMARLTPREKALVDWIVTEMTDLGELGNVTSRLINGVSIYNSERYFTLVGAVYRDKASSRAEETDLRANSTLHRQQVDRKGMTKERQPHRHVILLRNIFDVYREHARDMTTYAAWSIPYRDAMDTLSRGRAKQELVKRWGVAGVNEMKDALGFLTYQQSYGDNWTGLDRMVSGFMRAFAVKTLGFRVSSMLLNRFGGSSMMTARAALENPKLAAAYAARVARRPVSTPVTMSKTDRAIAEKLVTESGYFYDRWVRSPFETFGQVAKRLEDERVTAGKSPRKVRLGLRYRRMRDLSMKGMGFFERLNAIDIYKALGDVGVPEAERVAMAERFTRDTQNPSTPMEDTGLYRTIKKNPLATLFMPFFGQGSIAADFVMRQWIRSKHDWSSGDRGKAASGLTIAIIGALMMAAYGVAQRTAFRRLRRGRMIGRDVDEKERDRENINVVADAARSVISLWYPVAGRFVDPAFAAARQAATGKTDLWWQAERVFDPAPMGTYRSAERTIRRAVGAMDGKALEQHEVERMVMDLADVLSTFTGFPWGGIEQTGSVIAGAAGHPLGQRKDASKAAAGPRRVMRPAAPRSPARPR